MANLARVRMPRCFPDVTHAKLFRDPEEFVEYYRQLWKDGEEPIAAVYHKPGSKVGRIIIRTYEQTGKAPGRLEMRAMIQGCSMDMAIVLACILDARSTAQRIPA